MPLATFPLERAHRGQDLILAHLDFYGKHPATGAAKTYHWSGIDAPSPQGWYEGRLGSMGDCSRRLSGRSGLPQGSPFDVRIADVDHKVRDFLANYHQKYLPRVQVDAGLIRAADLKAANTPMIVQRGIVADYSWDETSVGLRLTDLISLRQDSKNPRRETESNWFSENLGLPE